MTRLSRWWLNATRCHTCSDLTCQVGTTLAAATRVIEVQRQVLAEHQLVDEVTRRLIEPEQRTRRPGRRYRT